MAERHMKLCGCSDCVARRFNEFIARLETFEGKYHIQPVSPDQTVAVKTYRVRSHFRRNPRHLNGDPALKNRVATYFKNVTRPIKKPPSDPEAS